MDMTNRLFKNIPRVPRFVLLTFLFVAILSPFLANEKPLLLIQYGHFSFPAFSNNAYTQLYSETGESENIRTDNINWTEIKSDFVLRALIPYSAGKSDLANSNFKSPFGKQFKETNGKLTEIPFRMRHFLGTGNLGNDTLAGLIEGTRVSLIIGICSMFIALFIGVLLGMLSGYFGNQYFKLNRAAFFTMLLLLLPAWYYCFELRFTSIENSFRDSIVFGVLNVLFSLVFSIFFIAVPVWMISKLKLPGFLQGSVKIPVDAIVNRIIELFLSIPRIVVLITFALIFQPSVASVVLIIGLTSWTSIARMVRAIILSLRESNYIDAGRAIGIPTLRLFRKHLLPATYAQLRVFTIYGVASAILAETGLSFLGIGVPPGTVTWGQLLFEGKENISAWWLILFPGLCVFLLLASLNTLADSLEKK